MMLNIVRIIILLYVVACILYKIPLIEYKHNTWLVDPMIIVFTALLFFNTNTKPYGNGK